MAEDLKDTLSGKGIPVPLSAMIELPSRGWNGSGEFKRRLEPLLMRLWEVQPVVSPEIFFSNYGPAFLKWCNSHETTVTLSLPFSSLTPDKVKILIENSLSRLNLFLGKIPSGGAKEKDFWRELEGLVLTIRKFRRKRGSHLPSLRFQTEGLAPNLPRLPHLVSLAGRLEIPEVVITPLGTPEHKYVVEASERAREMGIRLDLGSGPFPPLNVGEVSPERERWRAGSPDNRAGIGLPQTESISPLSNFRTRLRNLLIREIPPPDFAAPARLRSTDEKRKSCLFPWNWTYISEEGEVRVCPVSRRSMGNMMERSFEKVWSCSEYGEFRKRLLSPYPLEECRRCALRGWFKPNEPTDWLWAGINDRFGVQLGTGWYEQEGSLPYRWSRKKADFSLRNSGKNSMTLILHLPSRKLAQKGQIRVNRKLVGEFRLKKPGDSLFRFRLPTSEDEYLLVEIECEEELVPHRILKNDDYRRLGIAFKGAFLKD